MKKNEIIAELIGEITKTKLVLSNIDSFYQDFKKNDFQTLGKNKTSSIVMAEIITDFYTCIETLFLRISHFFENNLQQNKWHSDLLHKMTLEIKDIRIAVISDETNSILIELMKFRHFKRYYFEFNYDWDKLDFLEKKYKQVKPLIENDLKAFESFLNKIHEMSKTEN